LNTIYCGVSHRRRRFPLPSTWRRSDKDQKIDKENLDIVPTAGITMFVRSSISGYDGRIEDSPSDFNHVIQGPSISASVYWPSCFRQKNDRVRVVVGFCPNQRIEIVNEPSDKRLQFTFCCDGYGCRLGSGLTFSNCIVRFKLLIGACRGNSLTWTTRVQ